MWTDVLPTLNLVTVLYIQIKTIAANLNLDYLILSDYDGGNKKRR